MKSYHKWLVKATVKNVIPNLTPQSIRSIASRLKSAKQKTSFLQAASLYVNSKAKSYRSAAATSQRECAVAAARAFKLARLAWK